MPQGCKSRKEELLHSGKRPANIAGGILDTQEVSQGRRDVRCVHGVEVPPGFDAFCVDEDRHVGVIGPQRTVSSTAATAKVGAPGPRTPSRRHRDPFRIHCSQES